MAGPDIAALSGVGVALLLFLLVAATSARKFREHNEFLFADGLTGGRIAANTSATFSSLAGPFLFFFLQTPIYGWFMIVLVALSVCGQFIFLSLAEKLDISKKNTGSIFRLVYSQTRSRWLASAVNVVVVLNFFAILLVELVIGASIFAYYASNMPNPQLVGLLLVGGIALLYIVMGGFRVVTYTDSWQLLLVAIGIVITLAVVLAGHWVSETARPLTDVFLNPTAPVLALFIFALNTLTTTTTQATVQISSWQRFASSENKNEFRKGTIRASLFQYSWIWVGCILLGAITAATAKEVTQIGDILDFIRGRGFLGSYVAFPLFFTGLVAAMISTVDSMLIAIMLGIKDFGEVRGEADDTKPNESVSKAKPSGKSLAGIFRMPQIYFLLIGVGLILLAATFFGAMRQLQENWRNAILQLMFAGYGQAALLFPLLYFLVRNSQGRTRTNTKTALVGVVAGFAVYWMANSYGIEYSRVEANQLAPVFAIFTTGILVWLAQIRDGSVD